MSNSCPQNKKSDSHTFCLCCGK
uniref:Uncharacterized protein n=1 Tax=Rhizophora mucronata TaxID=61149 RepID=A0A2P2PPN9_RHIMU